jgi:hypothetical protein
MKRFATTVLLAALGAVRGQGTITAIDSVTLTSTSCAWGETTSFAVTVTGSSASGTLNDVTCAFRAGVDNDGVLETDDSDAEVGLAAIAYTLPAGSGAVTMSCDWQVSSITDVAVYVVASLDGGALTKTSTTFCSPRIPHPSAAPTVPMPTSEGIEVSFDWSNNAGFWIAALDVTTTISMSYNGANKDASGYAKVDVVDAGTGGLEYEATIKALHAVSPGSDTDPLVITWRNDDLAAAEAIAPEAPSPAPTLNPRIGDTRRLEVPADYFRWNATGGGAPVLALRITEATTPSSSPGRPGAY